MYTVASPAVVVPLATWTRTLDLSTMCGAVVVVVATSAGWLAPTTMALSIEASRKPPRRKEQ